MSPGALWAWSPAVVLLAGSLFTQGVGSQRAMDLRQDLATAIPVEIQGMASRDIEISEREVRVAGMSSYLLREFFEPGETVGSAADTGEIERTAFSVYIGYYESQTQGKTIHSPKNCLPGAGWEALESRQIQLNTDMGVVPANRYVLQRGEDRALVIYWYQGRGRVAANEYRVKLHLLRDAALRGRSEEALVRLVVPITSGEEAAFDLASEAAATVATSLTAALPT